MEPVKDQLCVERQQDLMLAVLELLLNAIEHGSLGFDYDEKSRLLESGAWEVATREQALNESEVVVDVVVERDRVVISIRDEGMGFDWRSLPDPRDPECLLEEHGRGVFMARLSVDSLQYNKSGNEVTVVKLFEAGSAHRRKAG